MRQLLAIVEGEVSVTVDGVTVSEVVETARVIRSAPNRIEQDGAWVANENLIGEMIGLYYHGGQLYVWDAPLEDWNETIESDPVLERRWVKRG